MSNKIEYADKDTLPESIDDRDVTVQISLKIEGDLLKAIRSRATAEGKPYQTLLKQMLRAQLGHHNGDPEDVRKRLADLEGQVQSLMKGPREIPARRPVKVRKKRA